MRQLAQRGFTLVELLVVVAILAILAAVLTPQFLKTRDAANQSAADAYARNVYTAMSTYLVIEPAAPNLTEINSTTGGCTLPASYEVSPPAKTNSCTVTLSDPVGTVTKVEVSVGGQTGSAPAVQASEPPASGGSG